MKIKEYRIESAETKEDLMKKVNDLIRGSEGRWMPINGVTVYKGESSERIYTKTFFMQVMVC